MKKRELFLDAVRGVERPILQNKSINYIHKPLDSLTDSSQVFLN